MSNNSKAAAKRTQVVMSEKSRTFVTKKKVTTKAGKVITVNVYKRNKNARPIKTILHPLPPPTDINVGENAKTMGKLPKHPELSPYQMERNQRRADERFAKNKRLGKVK